MFSYWIDKFLACLNKDRNLMTSKLLQTSSLMRSVSMFLFAYDFHKKYYDNATA